MKIAREISKQKPKMTRSQKGSLPGQKKTRTKHQQLDIFDRETLEKLLASRQKIPK